MASSSRSGFVGFAMVAVMMLVAAMMATTYISRQENQAVWEPKEKVKTGLATVKEALDAYQREHGRLPCPAPRNLSASNSSYGTPISGNDCDGIVAGTEPAGTKIVDDMIFGALPTRELGLPDKAGEDKWGNKLTYAVTQLLTDPLTYGVVPAVTNSGKGRGQLLGKATSSELSYVVLSHGADKKGAAGVKSNNDAAMGAACSGSGADRENCDFDDTIFQLDDLKTEAGSSFFDDQMLVETTDASGTMAAIQATMQPCLDQDGLDPDGAGPLTATPVVVQWTVDNGNGGRTCSATFNESGFGLAHGGTVSLTNAVTGHAGAANFTCVNGTLTPEAGATCVQHCNASTSGTKSWTVNNGNGDRVCSVSAYAQIDHNTNRTNVANDNTTSVTGTATLTCNDGVLTASATNCNAKCPASTATPTWSVHNCQGATSAATTHNSNASVTNIVAGRTGTASFTCNDGTLNSTPIAGATCTPDNCPSAALTWGGNCTATVSGTHGQSSIALSDPVAGTYTGSGTATCSYGNLTVNGGAVCYENCASQTVSWANCKVSAGPVTHGTGGIALNDSNSAADPVSAIGTATGTCTNGVITASGATCNPPVVNCTAQTVNWGAGCSASVGAITHGTNTSTANAAGGYTGSVTVTCNNGTLNQSSVVCNAHCASQTVTWGSGNCSATVSGTHGNECITFSNSASGYSGVAAGSCNNGTISVNGGATCNAVPVNGACNNSVALGCSAGTAISDNGQTACGTTRQWVCQGQNGGSNSGTCSKANAACTPVGVCNNSTPLGCSVGSAISDNGQTACGTTRTWVCNAAGGNSGGCSYNNGACPVCGNGAVNFPDCTVCGDGVGFTRYITTSCPAPYTAGNAVQPQTRGSCSGGWADNGAPDTQDCSIPGQDGVCDSVSNSCVVGTPQNYAAGTCGGAETWECAGISGGLTEACSIANAACAGCSGGTDGLSGATCQSWASWCYTSTINLCSQSASFNSLPNGGQFRVRASLAGSSWGPTFVPEPLFNKGSAYSAYFHTGGRKYTHGYIVYDGGCNIYGQAAKGGRKSDYNWGAITLQQVTSSCPVNGGWGPWSAPSCLCACGPTTEWRFRNCDSPAPSGGGAYCVGAGGEDTGVACPDNYDCCGGGDSGGYYT